MRTGYSILILLFILVVPHLVRSQIKFDQTEINLGILDNWSRQPAEFFFKNTSTQNIAILRVQASDEVHARFPANFILPGQVSRIQVYYEPTEPGSFREEIKVYSSASEKPIKLVISGKVISVTECPSINNNDYAIPSFQQNGNVLDSSNKNPVQGANIKFIDAQKTVNRIKTDKTGSFSIRLDRGIYTVIIDAPGYNLYAEEIYLDKNSDPLLFLLGKPEQVVKTAENNVKPNTASPIQNNLLNGTVLDAKSKNPVFKAGVNIQDINRRINYYYLTWKDGKFSYHIKPGTYRVDIIARNYEHLIDTLVFSGTNPPVSYELIPVKLQQDSLLVSNQNQNKIYSVLEGTVVDITSNKPLSNVKIRFYDKYNVPAIYTTYKNGKFRKELIPGNYKVVIKTRGYETFTRQLSIRNDSFNMVFALTKTTTIADSASKVVLAGNDIKLNSEPDLDTVVYAYSAEKSSQDQAVTKPAGMISELDRSVYSANNIVFLVDVSGSMKEYNKMDLLKASMKNLIVVLRDIDLISIITYASKQTVMVSSVKGSEKKLINGVIDSLQPHGFTYGMEGLQKAFEELKKSYVENGNNQLILVTDGLFNSPSFTEADILKLVNSMKNTGIITSVIGFGKEEEGIKTIKKIARKGGGNFLIIDSEKTAQNVLVREIMNNSGKKMK